MSPAHNSHGIFQSKITILLHSLLPEGTVIIKCGIRTSDSVKVTDVAWISKSRLDQVKDEIAYSIAPEICIEIISPSNSEAEMEFKRQLYFEKGAKECWICTEKGDILFFGSNGISEKSILVPDFPSKVEI